jgi:hypothetical protein
MHRSRTPAVGAALALALAVPTAASAADATGPLEAPGKGGGAPTAQLSFPLADGWSQDFLGAKTFNRGAFDSGTYGRDVTVGTSNCQLIIGTGGQARARGLDRENPGVRLRWNGEELGFHTMERGHQGALRWYRAKTTLDPDATGYDWEAQSIGVAVLPTPRGVGIPSRARTTVVVAQGFADAFGVNADGTQRVATPDERAQCAHLAPAALAAGLRPILGGVRVVRR